MNKEIKLALKSDHMDDNIVAKPFVGSPVNPWNTMHWHDFYEIELILDGEGTIICNNQEYPIKRGMVSFLTPFDMHKYVINSDIQTICIKFTEDSISKEIFESLLTVKSNVIYLDNEYLQSVHSICNLLNTDLLKSISENLYKSKLLESLIILLKNEFSKASATDKNPTPIQKALSYIHSHFKEDPKMSDVANTLFLNEHYFCSLFKEHIGESYKSYLRKLKLNYAQKLITHTTIPITQIAMESGYSSISNFNKDFKRFFNISPKDMRQKYIEK